MTETVTKHVIEDRAKVYGEKVALMDSERRITYEELNIISNRIGNGLLSIGVKKQDHVLIMLPNCLEFIYSWLGLCKIGAIEIPINTAYKGSIFKYVINNSNAKYMIIEKQYLDKISAVQDDLTSLQHLVILDISGVQEETPGNTKFVQHSFGDLLDADSSVPDVGKIRYSDVMAIMYTSGTTGPSKGVIIPYRQAYDYSIGFTETGFVEAKDIFYVTLPLFHIGGQWACVYSTILVGGTVRITDGFHVSRFWKEIDDCKATVTFLFGVMASFIYRQKPNENDGKASLRKVFMPPLIPELEDFKKRFKVKVATTYALTEGSLVLFSDSDELKPDQCGVQRKGFDLRIANEFDEELLPFEEGELLIRSHNPWTTMIGYHTMPEETIRAYRNQWLHTGDVMYKDEEGNYYFKDRVKDVIRRRGENVSSFEVEKEVNSHPCVMESAAIAVKSEHSEDEIKVAIKLRPGCRVSPEELISYLEPRMAYFMIPRYIEFFEEFPKTPTQRIQKTELRKTGIQNAWDREKAGIKIKK
jgi:crotonobetaine/carnitine-CoA ligase